MAHPPTSADTSFLYVSMTIDMLMYQKGCNMAFFHLNLTKDAINYGENLPVLSLDKVLKPLSLAPILSSTGPLE